MMNWISSFYLRKQSIIKLASKCCNEIDNYVLREFQMFNKQTKQLTKPRIVHIFTNVIAQEAFRLDMFV